MLDLILTPLALLHVLSLLGLLVFFCKRLSVPWRDAPFFVLFLFWSVLVFAGHGAGLLGSLGNLEVYAPMTFAALLPMALWTRALWRLPAAPSLLTAPPLSFAPSPQGRTRTILFWALGGTLALFGVISFVIGQCVYPDNADSMIYRLPRAVWYVSHGSFLHPFPAPDNRILYYPLNGVALYIPLVLYNLPGTWHALPSFVAWGVIVYTTYRFARALGAERLWALFASWLVGLTPSILAQATSTNDEILTGAAFLGVLYMGWRWLVTGRPAYVFMAAMALGLSAGTKLHIVFLLPMIGAALALAFWPPRAARARLSLWGQRLGGKTAGASLLVLALLFCPFLFYNYASVGRFYFFDDFKQDVFNLSASLAVGGQNLLIYLAQMILSPVADMNMWPVANDRQAFNSALNALFDPLIRPLLNDNPAFYHLNYRFVGITIPVSVRFVEFALWAGFVWLLWPVQAVLLARRPWGLRGLFLLIALTPPLWLFFWSFSTLYMEGTATYFAFYLICAAPAAGAAFIAIRRPLLNEIRWVLVSFVALSSLVIAHNLVMYSGFRALPDLFYARSLPYDWLLTEERIIKEIRAADRIRIVFTHEKMPYFGYMHWHPKATYYTPFDVKPPYHIEKDKDVLQILPVSSLNIYGFMPLKITGKKTPGVTYLGSVRAIGREAIFAVGRGVEQRYPDESDYILLQATIMPRNAQEWSVFLPSDPLGFSAEDHLTFAYELTEGDTVLAHRPAEKTPSLSLILPFNPHVRQLMLTIVVSSALSGKEVARARYHLGGAGAWLPDGAEY